jgi:hypothetical protein
VKPTKSKLLPLNKSAYWWLGEKSNAFAFKKGQDWWMIKPSASSKKPTALREGRKSPRKEKDSVGYYAIALTLAAILGISVALNFIAFYYLF